MDAFVCIVEIRLHVNESRSLKTKRKHVRSISEQLRRRFGAAVAEVGGQGTWQRATLLCALVGGSEVSARADKLERFVEARLPDGCTFERDLRSLSDLRE